jgi:hypothetical protein
MTRDPLDMVARLRRMAVEEAGRAMREAARTEAATALAVTTLREAIFRETEIAGSLSAGDVAVEAFGEWLKVTRREAAAAGAPHERAEADTARARIVLTRARAGARVATDLVATHAAEDELAMQRRAQRELDDFRRTRGRRQSS